jgi:hypothetical protein
VPAAETQSAVRAAYEDLPRVFTRIPCGLGASAYLALPVTEAATGLDAALRATQAHRLHLAPLDLAQDLPPLEFGSGKVCRFAELGAPHSTTTVMAGRSRKRVL